MELIQEGVETGTLTLSNEVVTYICKIIAASCARGGVTANEMQSVGWIYDQLAKHVRDNTTEESPTEGQSEMDFGAAPQN